MEMKKHILILLISLIVIAIMLFSSSKNVNAQTSGTGIGVILGEPTGLSLKTWTGRNTALDLGAAWSFTDEDKLHIHADWLKHFWGVLNENTQGIELPLYCGIGGRVKLEDDARAGVRFVGGIDIIFEEAPIDIFVEIAPILDIAPETEFNGNANLGFRYWF